jgi:asparagine synthase (glutamine-hydrolysing)
LPSRAPQELLTYGDQEYVETLDLSVAYPQLVFSGDDGSISVGYVYVEEAEVQLMKEGRVQQAIEQFLHDKPLPRKLFRADVYRRLKQVAFDGVLEELERIDVRNPEKAFYFFHMENSHRRILRKFVCEDIDVRRIEYVQPFYDGHFIELIASAPAAWGLAHRLYHQWLTRFPQQTVQVPWQTYPGHLPCPVKGLTITRTQWQPTRAKRFWASQPFLPRCWEAMTRWQFPCALMRRPVVLLAYALHQTRIKDYSYIIELCAKISDYFERCGGRLVFPE